MSFIISEEIINELKKHDYGYYYFADTEHYLDNTLYKIQDITPYDELTHFILINTRQRLSTIVDNVNLTNEEIITFVTKYNVCDIIDAYVKLYDMFIRKTLTNLYHEFLMGKMIINKNIKLINGFIKKYKICYDIRSVIISFM